MNLAERTDHAQQVLGELLGRAQKPVLAFSGGKDSIVACHIAAGMGITRAVCETSFYMHRQIEDAKRTAALLGLDCEFVCSLDREWLRRHSDIIFTDDNARRSWWMGARQQATVKRYARRHGCDAQIFGRRTEENSVRAELYTTRAGLQCHPIRRWREAEVWEYIDHHRIPHPWIYSTFFGDKVGNGPFFLMRERYLGSKEACWDLIESMDPRIRREDYV